MNTDTIHREFLFTGIQSTTDANSFPTDMQAMGEEAEQAGLPDRILHQQEPECAYLIMWNWSPTERFPLMTALAVSSADNQPADSVTRQFPKCEYAVIPMEGSVPNLVEPWPEILTWYPLDITGFTTTIGRYNLENGTGDILVPMTPNLAPMEGTP